MGIQRERYRLALSVYQ